MTRKERYDFVLGYFRKNVGHVTTELNFGSAFQLLCATLLSAQCTDKRINALLQSCSVIILMRKLWQRLLLRMFLNM